MSEGDRRLIFEFASQIVRKKRTSPNAAVHRASRGLLYLYTQVGAPRRIFSRSRLVNVMKSVYILATARIGHAVLSLIRTSSIPIRSRRDTAYFPTSTEQIFGL